MNLVTLDFETYFADDYTLSKMTTEEYVRDPRFKVHCLGYRNNDKNEIGYLGNLHLFGKPTLIAPIRGLFLGHDGWRDAAILAHHAHFDGLILSHYYGIKPAFWFDTLSMARLIFPHAKSHSLKYLAEMLDLPQKTVPYQDFKNVRDLPPDLYQRVAEGCAQDVELTYAIFKKMLPLVPKAELKIIDLTIRLFTEPALRLHRGTLVDYLQNTAEEKSDALATCGATAEDVGSNEKFAALLRSLGVEPPVKISKTTKKETYAFAKTDVGLRALLDSPDDSVSNLVAARLGVKSNMVETRARRMLAMDARGAMCVYLKYCGAHTLRWSGGDKMNWQNFKRKSVVREAVTAPPGMAIIVVDASQIECRMLNWLAGQQDMLEKFRRKEDIYSEIASQFYGEHVDKNKPEKRGTGKQIILSCGYRAGAETIQNTARLGLYGPPVHLTLEQSKAARDLYRSTHPCIVNAWKSCDLYLLPALLQGGEFSYKKDVCEVRDKKIFVPGGAWLDYSHLHNTVDNYNRPKYYTIGRKGVQNMHGGILIQNIIEALSRQILAGVMLKLSEHFKIVSCTHDEVVYLAPLKNAQAAFDYGIAFMRTPPEWCRDIPLDAEGGWAENYSK